MYSFILTSATTFQVELEAESKDNSAMNVRCEGSWTTPMELALKNNDNPAVFSAIVEHFKLKADVRHLAENLALMQLREAYRDLLSSASWVVGSIEEPTDSANRAGDEHGPILIGINKEVFNIIYHDAFDTFDNRSNNYIDIDPSDHKILESGDPLDYHIQDLEHYRARLAIYEILSAQSE